MKSLLLAALAAAALCGCATVGSDERGVVTANYGRVTGEVKDPGFTLVNPFGGGVHPVNVGTQKHEVKAGAASHDLQHVDTTIAVNYHVDADPKTLTSLYAKMPSLDYADKVIDPTVQDSLKAATANYRAEDLIDRREAVRTKIENDLRSRLAPYGIHVDQVNMTNFDFTEEFNKAVERKVVALQDKATAQTEAETARIRAIGQANAFNAQKQSLNANLLYSKFLDKWDGHLPQYMGGQTPFVIQPPPVK